MNDECRMSNVEGIRSSKDEMEAGALFMFFHSSLVILASFDIRYSSFESGAPAHA